ncbi:MAG: hypothetical protein Q9164_004975 [Protoblastenia rupestris]
MDSILQAFSDIGDVLPRVDRLKATFQHDTNLNEVIGLIYSDIIEFFRRAYKFFRRKAWHLWFAFDWGLFERRFNTILQKLSSHCDLLDKEAATVHFAEMKKYRDQRQLEEDAFEQRRQIQMAQDVSGWLQGVEDHHQEDRLRQISDSRQPGTCNWVLEDPQMRAWVEDDSEDAILWMTGIPGAGKSFLCSLIIQYIQTREDRSSLYFFCDDKSSGKDFCGRVLRTLTVQLLRQNLDMIPLVHEAFYQKIASLSGPGMTKILCQILPTVKATRIVVDGFDEITHEIQLQVLKSLLEIQKQAGYTCKLLISSREEPQIEKFLSLKSSMRLGEKTTTGLKLYIKERVKMLQNSFPSMDNSLLNTVETRLQDKAKGMFLWVRLVSTMLVEKTSEIEVECAIDDLPEGLDEAYRRIILRLQDSLGSYLRERAFKILYWVCMSLRPVTLYEVTDGIAIEPRKTVLNKKTRSINPRRDIVELCAPLLETSSNGTLDMVHFSAKEYLIHKHSGPFIDIAEAHFHIASSCIINLTSSLDLLPGYIGNISESDLETRVVQGNYGLHAYGHEFWAEHLTAYLLQTSDLSSRSRELMSMLQAFSPVCKHPNENLRSIPSGFNTDFVIGIEKIKQFPKFFSLVSGWLLFKSRSHDPKLNFSTFESQQKWLLQNDETHLTHIQLRMREITERMLRMSSSQLPSHIDHNEHKDFLDRYRLPCRFMDCCHCFDFIQDRDKHEASHVPSFPCPQCDFSERGFTSRKDLERHIKNYHMSAEDFEIPGDLQSAGNIPQAARTMASGNVFAPSSRSRCWNEQGRSVLQRSFRQILGRVESEMQSESYNINQRSPSAPTPNVSASTSQVDASTGVDKIRKKIDREQYETLASFKHDLQVLSTTSGASLVLTVDGDIGSICTTEIQKATSKYPNFANFNAIQSASIEAEVSLDILDGPRATKLGSSFDHQNEATALDTSCFDRQTSYWSTTEETEFPKLLRRWGKDFEKIADYLKTKTADEVGRHFAHLVGMGRADLLDLAKNEDTSLQESQDTVSSLEARNPNIVKPSVKASTGDMSLLLPQPAQHLEARKSYHPQPANLSEKVQPQQLGAVAQVQAAREVNEAIARPEPRKRRPPPKALCPECTQEETWFHNEYARDKHIDRFHKSTRKMLICNDISLDKKFLARCKPCSTNKRYSSRHLAGKHLRKKHFSTETSAETLRRWMQETEEPNPNYQITKPDVPSMDTHIAKRPKLDDWPSQLPPIRSRPPLPNLSSNASSPMGHSESGDNQDENESSPVPIAPDGQTTKKTVLLPEFSFDNLIPGQYNKPDTNGPPHRKNRAFIQPDQVQRLPHLGNSRKEACLDQVQALHHRLDHETVGTQKYNTELENLASLSRMLIKNLRDWRRVLSRAPEIPFSI